MPPPFNGGDLALEVHDGRPTMCMLVEDPDPNILWGAQSSEVAYTLLFGALPGVVGDVEVKSGDAWTHAEEVHAVGEVTVFVATAPAGQSFSLLRWADDSGGSTQCVINLDRSFGLADCSSSER